MSSERPIHEDEERVVITDKRKVDRGGSTAAPAGGESGAPAAGESAAGSGPQAPAGAPDRGAGADENAQLLAERTADLQRLQAEYANYRRRAERERLAAGDIAVSRVLADFLPVLDNLDRARAHGDLSGGLKAVADQLDDVFGKLGLVPFGEVGDRFDPAIHEAVLHDESEAVDAPTCTTIMRPGYKLNDRLIRPAMVGVTDPVYPGGQAHPGDGAGEQAAGPDAPGEQAADDNDQ